MQGRAAPPAKAAGAPVRMARPYRINCLTCYAKSATSRISGW